MADLNQLVAVISTEGHILLPRQIREKLNWQPGTRLSVELVTDGLRLRTAQTFDASTVDALFGSLQYAGPTLSIDDMNAAVATEAERGRNA